ncbi:uncharacterized protein LOC113359627 [Papaver somniferum]|uniref:uncharacterized protein LOC113359627 n=1 Tax=Papaver somniferum TaxID=3469 RepID=UPI000E7054A2|nr:uncharacterized protein LOC113359627 [Papaver somniferum]
MEQDPVERPISPTSNKENSSMVEDKVEAPVTNMFDVLIQQPDDISVIEGMRPVKVLAQEFNSGQGGGSIASSSQNNDASKPNGARGKFLVKSNIYALINMGPKGVDLKNSRVLKRPLWFLMMTFKIGGWNIRGLNDPLKLKEVGRFVALNKLSLVGIVETHVHEMNKDIIRLSINKNWRFLDNYENNESGKIWESEIRCLLCYGDNNSRNRLALWNDITAFASSCEIPWVVLGDFNEILAPHERIGGTSGGNSSSKDFLECISMSQLLELPYSGDFFTRSNKQIGQGRIVSKIDRVLVNIEWVTCFTKSKAEFQNPGIYDHSPMVVYIFERREHGPPPFRFFYYLSEEQEFFDIVRTAWSEKVQGNPMFVLVSKMKRVKTLITDWRKVRFNNLSESVVTAKADMVQAQAAVQLRPLDTEVASREKRVVCHYAKEARLEESMLKQQSRVQWMDLGDSNTAFFHDSLKERRWRNNILTLVDGNGNLLEEDKDIALECTQFFTSLFNGSSSSPFTEEDTTFLQFSNTVSMEDATALGAPITRDEIVYALSCIGSNKAPGPDGFTSHFFKVCWQIVEADFVRAVTNFFSMSRMLGEVNNTFLILVPKVENSSFITDFRPIACCNVIYKCKSKILAIRMKRILKDLVIPNQSAFISGRSIQDNIMLAHELVRNYHWKNGPPRCALKIDLRKAYDTVSWEAIVLCLNKMGFPRIFIDWVYLCISSAKFVVLVNGSPYGYFSASRGLRQGCPLSPYLFVMGQLGPMIHLIIILSVFSKISGLERNRQKTTLFHSSIDSAELDLIVHCLDFSTGELPIRYLGVPMLSSKLSYKDCLPLLSKVTKRDQSWRAKNLTDAGTMRLIKVVLNGIILFWIACFVLPKRVIKELISICKQFLWAGAGLEKKSCPVNCDLICRPFAEGGLGVRSINIFNEATNLRHLWDLVSGKVTIWTDWVSKNLINNTSWLYDSWHPIGRLVDWVRSDIIEELFPNPDCKVSQFLDDSGWCLPDSVDEEHVAILDKLKIVEFDRTKSDVIVWQPCPSGDFTVKHTYNALVGAGDKIFWKSLVWFKSHVPRHSFISWLGFHGRLKTKDKMVKWGLMQSAPCSLCENGIETIEHIFHDCRFVVSIWTCLLLKMGYVREVSSSWLEEVKWCVNAFAGQGLVARIKKLILNCFMYHIWKERNTIIFTSKDNSTDQVGFAIMEEVRITVISIKTPVKDSPAARSFVDKLRLNCEFFQVNGRFLPWLALDYDEIMVNTDGSKGENSGGCGAILSGKGGGVIAAAMGGGPPITADVHELHGVELGLNLAKVKNCRKIHITVNSMTIYNLLRKRVEKPPWRFLQAWRRITLLWNSFDSIKISHVFRETNRAADMLASYHPPIKWVDIDETEFSHELRTIIMEDREGRLYYRE